MTQLGAAIAALLLLAGACSGMSEPQNAPAPGGVIGGGPGYVSGGIEGAVGAAVGNVIEYEVHKPK
jgi:hypothetical protein